MSAPVVPLAPRVAGRSTPVERPGSFDQVAPGGNPGATDHFLFFGGAVSLGAAAVQRGRSRIFDTSVVTCGWVAG